MTAQLGARIGEAFVARGPDGEIAGTGSYCGFPIILRLEPAERDGQRGYVVAIYVGPAREPGR